MSFSVQRKIAANELSIAHLIFTVVFNTNGAIVQLNWHPTYRQLHLSVETNLPEPPIIYFHFTGYYKGRENTDLQVPSVGNPSRSIATGGYFTPNMQPSADYELMTSNATLKLDDCTLINQNGEVIKFDLHADYNSNGNINQDSLVILASGLNVDKVIQRVG